MLPAGKSLRTLREKLGLTMRDVETSSARMAEKYRNEEFSIPPSRLSDIETKNVLPSIFRLYTLAVIYRRDLRELLAWYGVDMNNMASDLGMIAPPRSHCPQCKCPSAWIPALISSAPPTSAAWWSSGVSCP
jgi:transcriptional regulator with XRE-family HTH domain